MKLCDDCNHDPPSETVEGVDGEFCPQCARYIREDARRRHRHWMQEQQAEYDDMYPALEDPWWAHEQGLTYSYKVLDLYCKKCFLKTRGCNGFDVLKEAKCIPNVVN